MASARRLPPCDVLAQLRADGMSNKDIGIQYGVSAEAVRQAMVRCGITTESPKANHAKYVPWRMRPYHAGKMVHRRLVLYSRAQQGRDLDERERRMLDDWMRFMDGDNSLGVPLSVHYDPNDDDGFWFEPRREGDHDYISPPSGQTA